MSKFEKIIYETENFVVRIGGLTIVSRQDGGHVQIRMKNPVSDRTKLIPKLAIEYIRLSMIVGSALKIAMNNRGIPVVCINYQDMGTWAWKETPPNPRMHMHIFGRSQNAKKQVFPEAVYIPARETGFFDDNERLNDEDIEELKKQIEIELQDPKYDPRPWSLQ